MAPIVVAGLLVAACAPSHAPTTARHVFVIVMENHTPAQALTGSFTASVAAQYRVAADYSAITHPSVPNYLALTSGQTWGVTDDSYHALPAADLGHQLTAAGVTWRAYMEGLTIMAAWTARFRMTRVIIRSPSTAEVARRMSFRSRP